MSAFGIGGVNAHVSLKADGISATENMHLLIETQVILESPRQFGIESNGKLKNCKLVDSKPCNGGYTNGTDASVDYTDSAHVNGMDKRSSPNILLFSAYNADSLNAQINAYCEYMAGHNPQLHDLAYTLANRRTHKPYRTYAVTRDMPTFEDIAATQFTEESPPCIAWIFSGQGTQWPEMGVDLIDNNATFRATIRKLDRYIETLQLPSPLSIEGKRA